MPQRHRIERLGIVRLDDPQILVQRMRLVGIRGRRAVDVDPIGRFDRLAAAADREFHRVQTRPQVDVIDLGPAARLPVAEIPLKLPLHRKRFRRVVAEQHADQRHVVVGQRHLADDLDDEIGHIAGRSATTRCPPPNGRRAASEKPRAGSASGASGSAIGRIDLPEGGHDGVGARGGMIVFELVQAGRKPNVVPAAGPRLPHRAVIARAPTATSLSSIDKKLQSWLDVMKPKTPAFGRSSNPV